MLFITSSHYLACINYISLITFRLTFYIYGFDHFGPFKSTSKRLIIQQQLTIGALPATSHLPCHLQQTCIDQNCQQIVNMKGAFLVRYDAE